MSKFASIGTHTEDGVEYCYRYHCTDEEWSEEWNEEHTKFMDDRGWIYTGKCKFNSGNGTLHIYERKLIRRLYNVFRNWCRIVICYVRDNYLHGRKG